MGGSCWHRSTTKWGLVDNEVNRNLAAFAEASQDANLAKIVYRRIIQLDPNAHIASNNLAMLLLEDQENLQEALDLVSKALKAMPDNTDYLDTRQLVLDAMPTIQQPSLSSK